MPSSLIRSTVVSHYLVPFESQRITGVYQFEPQRIHTQNHGQFACDSVGQRKGIGTPCDFRVISINFAITAVILRRSDRRIKHNVSFNALDRPDQRLLKRFPNTFAVTRISKLLLLSLK